jgi:hypothetical protein
MVDGLRITVIVSVCAPDSFAIEADLGRARSAIERSAPDTTVRLESDEPFIVRAEPELTASKAVYLFDGEAGVSHSSLYFVAANGWVVSIRTQMPGAASADVAKLMDTFVREQSWAALGIPGDHGSGS